MKRLFPRAVPGAIAVLGLVMFVSASCSPNQSVKAGAPVLKQLTILEGGASPTDITADTKE